MSAAVDAASSSATAEVFEPKAKVCLISIDGWGLAPPSPGNAIDLAKTPIMDSFAANATQFAHLEAHGFAVGLPEGVMGNSEVGHLTMGAGQVQFQDLARINFSIKEGSFFTNATLVEALQRARATNGRVHFLGLVSDGGVHSHIQHLFAFLKAAKDQGVPEAFVHFIGDGRDTAPTSATTYLQQVLTHLHETAYGSLATVVGRYYAMDRDKRWERVAIAYEAYLAGKGEVAAADQIVAKVQERYAQGQNDEFLTPIIVNPQGVVQANDTLIFINFRADRMREIVETLGVKNRMPEDVQARCTVPANLHIVQTTQYNESFPLPVIFKPQSFKNVLAEWLSNHKVRQFHTAETEKYAHVTFFFNGGREGSFDLEDRALVASPKVATYDLAPTMNMSGVRDEIIKAMATQHYPLVMCNLAPPDMVGHTGVLEKTITAVEATDVILGEILEGCKQHGYILVISADHGNAEDMIAEDGNPRTSHTCNPVPLVVANTVSPFKRNNGGLRDVAPTVLTLMGLPIPAEMTGVSLV